jgi:renalase
LTILENTTAIIGAGMAGLTAARRLTEAGQRVTLFDKGRKPGGRLSTRRGDVFTHNHGCQYATARNPGFLDLLEQHGRNWVAAGGPRYVGVPDMAAIAEALATGLDVQLETTVAAIRATAGGWDIAFADRTTKTFTTLLFAIPAPQALALLTPTGHGFASQLAAVHLAPCWAVMLGFAGTLAGPDIMRPDQNPLAFIARENSRPGRAAAPVAYTLHATPGWSTDHLEDPPEAVTTALIAAFAAATGITEPPAYARAHRWRYALADRPLGQNCLWDQATRLGLAGDWCLDGKLEAAYLSGASLAERILA